MDKTNAMRILDRNNISYEVREYDETVTDGERVAMLVGENPDMVFKTLVTVGGVGKYFVFIVPVNKALDLKKAANVAGVKSIEMLKQNDLFPLTGYIHGGCSPVGMKKVFPTFLDSSAMRYDAICISGGRVGRQVRVNPHDLSKAIKITPCDLTREK